MGFLDNTSITVDAILTKRGREILSQGGDFTVTKFALSDEEIDYTLYDVTHPDGSDSYGSVIENMNLLEAVPNRQNFQSYLVDKTLAGATIKLDKTQVGGTTGIEHGTEVPINPKTDGFGTEEYIFTIENTNIIAFKDASSAKTKTGATAVLVTQIFGEPAIATTTVTVQGVDSSMRRVITVVVKAKPDSDNDANGTQGDGDTTGDGGTTGNGNGGGGSGGSGGYDT